MDKTSKQFHSVCIYLLLALATLAVYWQVHSYDFTNYDDNDYITQNNHVKAGLTRDGVIWAFTTGYASNWHPVTWLSHMLDCQLFGTDAGRHHLTNLLLHIINTLLLFTVLKQMTGAVWASGFVAACFALHPLHVESVAWIAERKDVLSTMFWMLTLLAYSHYVKRPAVGRYLLIVLTLALGLMAKPMLVTLPFVLLLLDYWPLGRLRFAAGEGIGRWRSLRGLVIEKIPLFLLSAASSVITFLVQRSGGAVKRVDTFSLIVRLSNTPVSYIKYIGKMFWPSRLAVFYPHPGGNLPIWQSVAAAVLLLIITVCVIRLAAKYRYLPVGWFWYIGTLIPVIGLVQVGDQAMADRYSYVPLTGLFIIIAFFVPQLLAGRRYRKSTLAVLSVTVLLALSISTHLQQRHWRSSTTVFEHALKVTSDNFVAHYYLTGPLCDEGKLDEAIQHFTETLRIKPEAAEVHKNMAKVLLRQDRLDEALEHFTEAARIKPDMADAHSNIGYILVRRDKLDEAVIYFNEALRIKPNLVTAHSNLGYALDQQGKYGQAVTHLEKVVQLDPNSSSAHYNLARTLVKAGRINEALACLNRTLQIEPEWVSPMNDLAWLLATHPDSSVQNAGRAITLAEQAAELTEYQNLIILYTLATAYAADGRFDYAADTAQKALALTSAARNSKLTEHISKQLESYRQQKPYPVPLPIQEPTSP